MEFEWDPPKAEENAEKHGVSFDEASSAFYDDHARLLADPDHSMDEARSILLGQSSGARILVVSFLLRGDSIRIISARPATPRENRKYHEGDSNA